MSHTTLALRLSRVSVVALLSAAVGLTAGCTANLNPLTGTSTPSTPSTPTPTTLTGSVVRSDTGTGIPSAQLALFDSTGSESTATTDALGAFSFDNVAAGAYTLDVAAAGYTNVSLALTFPVSSFTVQMLPLGAPSTVSIVSVTVTGPASIAVGQSVQLTATALYTDGHTSNVSALAKWSTPAPSPVTISSAGLVTAYTAGKTTVTATYGNTYGRLDLTVTP